MKINNIDEVLMLKENLPALLDSLYYTLYYNLIQVRNYINCIISKTQSVEKKLAKHKYTLNGYRDITKTHALIMNIVIKVELI